MNKLMLALVLMVSAIFSGAFAMGFNGDVFVSEPSQLIVDVGSGSSTMFLVAKKSMLIKNTVALNTQNAKSIGVKFAEGTGGYISGIGLAVVPVYINGQYHLAIVSGQYQSIFYNKKGNRLILSKKGFKVISKYRSPSTSNA